MSAILNIWLGKNTYKAAKCSCGKKLVQGDEVVIVARAQGSFTSVSSYHVACSKKIVDEAYQEAQKIIQNLILISQKIDEVKSTEANEQV